MQRSRRFGFAGPAQRPPDGRQRRPGSTRGAVAPCYHRPRSFIRGVASQGRRRCRWLSLPPVRPHSDNQSSPPLPSQRRPAGGRGRCSRWRWPSSAAEDTVTLNFVNADIDAVVKAAAEITGRNFILDPKIKGTVNIVSARPVPRELVYPTLLSALRLQGIVAVEGNGVTKLVLEADAQAAGLGGGARPVSGRRRPAGHAGRHAALRIGAAAGQRAAPADHAEQHDRRLSGNQRAHHHRLRRQPAAHRQDHRVARPAAARASR